MTRQPAIEAEAEWDGLLGSTQFAALTCFNNQENVRTMTGIHGQTVIFKAAFSQSEKRQLLNEATVMRNLEALQDQGVIPKLLAQGFVYDVFFNRVPALVLEFVGHQDTASLEQDQLKLLKPQLEACFEKLWQHRVAHGDIHKRNVVVQNRNGSKCPVIIDFGLSVLEADDEKLQNEREIVASVFGFGSDDGAETSVFV